MPLLPNGHREIEPALAQVDIADLPGFAGFRQGFGKEQVPHQQLQQDGHIAEELDIGLTEPAHQRIARKSRHPQQRAQNRGQHNAQHRHPQGIDQTHQKGLEVTLVGFEGQQRLADVKAGCLPQKAKPALDAALAHVDQSVVPQVPKAERNQRQSQQLIDKPTESLAAP